MDKKRSLPPTSSFGTSGMPSGEDARGQTSLRCLPKPCRSGQRLLPPPARRGTLYPRRSGHISRQLGISLDSLSGISLTEDTHFDHRTSMRARTRKDITTPPYVLYRHVRHIPDRHQPQLWDISSRLAGDQHGGICDPVQVPISSSAL